MVYAKTRFVVLIRTVPVFWSCISVENLTVPGISPANVLATPIDISTGWFVRK